LTQIYLSIGSNIDREYSVVQGVRALQNRFGELVISAVYESAAVGFAGDAFYNLVVGFKSELSWEDIQQQLRKIEDDNGRERSAEKFKSRTLDIDLLIYGKLDLQDKGVDLPRAEIFEYAFVLKPLAEIAGAELHPQTGKSYSRIWGEFEKSEQGRMQPLQRVVGINF